MDAKSRAPFDPLTASDGPELPSAPAPVHLKASSPQRARAAAGAQATPAPAMDRDFIARNQIVERYLSGKLPIKGATEFERFCREHPQLLDELGLPERVNAGVRLLEASGKPEPWQERKRILESPVLSVLSLAAAIVLGAAFAVAQGGKSDQSARIAKLEKQLAEQPLDPAASTRTIRLLPARRGGGSDSPAVVIGGGAAQLADLKIDMSQSDFHTFRVIVDRVGQGRVMVLNNVNKDSNGHVRIALNSSALGPGNYRFSIEGLTWRGDAVPDAWITIGVAR